MPEQRAGGGRGLRRWPSPGELAPPRGKDSPVAADSVGAAGSLPLSLNKAIWQCPLEILDAVIGDLRVEELDA